MAEMADNWREITHGGLPVVIYDEKVPDRIGFTIHGRVEIRDSGGHRWVPQAWTANGKALGDGFRSPHPLDLMPSFLKRVMG